MGMEQQCGVYGKLPMHGDFVHRNLPATFVKTWDEWLQLYIASSKEQMGDEWLDTYLTSPIWRFVLSSGVIDEQHWAGIMLPSVDHVGRYYPFSIVMPLDPELNPLEFVSFHTHWFESIEELALQALEEQFSVDELVDKVNGINVDFTLSYIKTTKATVKAGQPLDTHSMQMNLEFDEQSPLSVYACFLDSIMLKTLNCYSIWTTRGSEKINPCLMSIKNLPAANQLPAMMDGQWAYWGWPQPYSVK
ncbi:MAG: type VI secretion system-associated protein TagF [Gammaproteobacteria bacterium]|nr:type VI secretion system-associated protein TagF [Gammaproteobacteria bacterium]